MCGSGSVWLGQRDQMSFIRHIGYAITGTTGTCLARQLAHATLIHRTDTVEGDDMVDLGADADPLANTVVMVAWHMGQHGFAAAQAQGV